MAKCKQCGSELSEYNRTGKCHRHSLPPDACGDWEPQFHHGLKAGEKREMRIQDEATLLLGKSGGICSPGQNPMHIRGARG
jgi:hypothetical protein